MNFCVPMWMMAWEKWEVQYGHGCLGLEFFFIAGLLKGIDDVMMANLLELPG